MKSLKNVIDDIDIWQENQELRRRLEEAEETLRAIREGEVDGLIVNSNQGEQIFTLVGADHYYRVLIEAMNEGALTLAADGIILYCNHSFAKMMQTPQQELIGSSFFNLLYPSDLCYLQIDIAINEGMARREIDLLRVDGSPLPVHLSINSMLVEGLEVLSLIITDLSEMKERAGELKLVNNQLRQEITERKQAEAAMRQSEEKFSKAFHGIPIMMTLATMDEGRFIDANNALCSQSGYTREELLGHTSIELNLFPHRIRPELFGRIVEEGRLENYELDLCTKFGEMRKCQCWTQLLNLNGELCHITGMIDITERKHLEETIHLSEEKFFIAFQSSPVMMSIVKKEDNTYIDVNDSWLKVFGLTREEVLGHTHLELNLWDDLEYLHEKGLLLERDKSVKNYEISFLNINGEIRTGLASSETIKMGEMTCILHTMIDITEQRRMEKEMARLDRLNLIGEMAASIGHEIRNPMAAVRGFIQLLNEQDYYEKDKIYFDLMIEELDRANEIISEYLGMAKNKPVDLQNQYLDQIVKDIYPLIEADANHKGMNIKLDLCKPPMPLLDKNEIRQLILNMARNGIDAMSESGTLTIGTTTEAGEIVLFIKDEGQGLPFELLDKLGTPFLTTKANGTGLGLAVCYSIAARHNARIDYETGPEGTTFKVCFPSEDEQIALF